MRPYDVRDVVEAFGAGQARIVNIKSTSKYKFIQSLYAEISSILVLYQFYAEMSAFNEFVGRERCSWSIWIHLTICLRRWSWQLLWSSWRKRYFFSKWIHNFNAPSALNYCIYKTSDSYTPALDYCINKTSDKKQKKQGKNKIALQHELEQSLLNERQG